MVASGVKRGTLARLHRENIMLRNTKQVAMLCGMKIKTASELSNATKVVRDIAKKIKVRPAYTQGNFTIYSDIDAMEISAEYKAASRPKPAPVPQFTTFVAQEAKLAILVARTDASMAKLDGLVSRMESILGIGHLGQFERTTRKADDVVVTSSNGRAKATDEITRPEPTTGF